MYRTSRCISIILIFAMCVSMAGCATTGSSDAQRTRNEGTAVGAGAGALIGGLAGALLGGDSKGALIGAAIGAAAGGAAGYAYGDHVASQKAKYASEEDWLDQCIASARQVNQETLAYNNQLRTDIARLDAETQALEKKYAARQASKKTLLAEKKTIDAAIKATDKTLARAKFELDSQKQAVAQVTEKNSKDETQALDTEIARLEGLIKELEQHSEDLASLSGRMSV
ncbi:YMGG-like glycine zipper-containing protein [Desulfobacter vibrioformis]|uniref:YMGG-like glycine zipper-containing protein n=1 Tax=Desulfobacter vibrioformis TaxID=34031 RepID=UPI00068B7DC1|nr:YMGG-like glycine zipper-containing protein [Desulfobacter vibrioformis]